MTTPLGQVTGNLQDLREMTAFVRVFIPTISNTKAYTGSYSVRNRWQYRTNGWAIVCGARLRPLRRLAQSCRGPVLTSPAPLLTLYNGGTLAAQFRWNGTTGNLELGNGSTTWSTVAAADAGVTPQAGGCISGCATQEAVSSATSTVIAVISYVSSGLPGTVSSAYFGGIRWNNYAYFNRLLYRWRYYKRKRSAATRQVSF